jgi:hypothetical protein
LCPPDRGIQPIPALPYPLRRRRRRCRRPLRLILSDTSDDFLVWCQEKQLSHLKCQTNSEIIVVIFFVVVVIFIVVIFFFVVVVIFIVVIFFFVVVVIDDTSCTFFTNVSALCSREKRKKIKYGCMGLETRFSHRSRRRIE